ncbi:hypothetical protein [Paenibacillus mucilaginosus]|uniref:hypothetical protein n=1 Tax=Paenibacillus mucilaginosus TaxID=61624 RepID=UPI003D1C5E7F
MASGFRTAEKLRDWSGGGGAQCFDFEKYDERYREGDLGSELEVYISLQDKSKDPSWRIAYRGSLVCCLN